MELYPDEFVLTYDKVAVTVQRQDRTPGGVELPDSIHSESVPEMPRGLVQAVGPDCKFVKRGDWVLIPANQPALRFVYKGRKMVCFLHEEEVVATLMPEFAGPAPVVSSKSELN